MKKILYAAALAAMTLSLAGCYEFFDNPKPPVRYDDAHFEAEGYEVKSIAEIKALFSNPANTLTKLPLTDAEKQNPPTRPGGNPYSLGNSDLYSYYYPITERFVTKGKIISDDAYGNFYRGLFIQDETGGIEIKVGENGMYTKFHPGETIYVVCDGLVLGNYRSMLSLGLAPKAEDISDNGSPYPNRFMELPVIVDRHVKRGPATTLDASDITTIGATQALTALELYNLCGKLVCFEELTSVWEPQVKVNGQDDTFQAGYPQVFYKFKFNTYGTMNFQELIDEWKAYRADPQNAPRPSYTHYLGETFTAPEPENLYLSGSSKDYPTWGFKQHDWDKELEQDDELNLDLEQDNYASAKFENTNFVLGNDGSNYDNNETILLVRTSGYSRFALNPVLADGKKASVTGIVQRYTAGSGRNIAYQIAVNTDKSGIVEIVEP